MSMTDQPMASSPVRSSVAPPNPPPQVQTPDAGAATRPGTPVQRFWRRAAYPILGLAAGACYSVSRAEYWDPGLTSFAFLLGTVLYLCLLERWIPFEVRWRLSGADWHDCGWYFLLSLMAGGTAQGLVVAVWGEVSVARWNLPLALELPIALLVGSLASYAMHWLGHHWGALWRLHGIHHVPLKVTVATNGINHWGDVLLAQVVVQATLAAVGFSPDAMLGVGLFLIAQGYFTHANIDVSIGWLNHVLASPEQHRLHHSTDLKEAGHFGSDLSIWDHLFGTFTWRPGRVPAAVGVLDPDDFPPTRRWLRTLVHPWVRPRRS